MKTDNTASIDVSGDVLSVTWNGSVWQSPTTGSQHGRVYDALAVELALHLAACGEGTEHIDGQYVRDQFEISR